jgi:DNA-binding MarR family transcriptional regulator
MQPPSAQKPERVIDEWLEVMRLIWTIDHRLQSISAHLHRELGVTGQQRLVIKLVGQYPGISAGEIADILRVHQSSLSVTFKKLVDGKILERRVDRVDGRRAMFFLTSRGRLNDATLAGTAEVAVKRTLSRSTAEAVAGAKTVLGDLLGELEAELAASSRG